MVVYLDLIFLVNLVIDAVLIMVTAWMRKLRPAWWRVLLSSAVGAAYVVMMFFPPLTFAFTFLIKFMLSVIMLLISFGFGGLQRFLRTLGAFYIVNFVAAGGILGTHYLVQNPGEVMNGIWFSASGGLSFELKIGFWFVLCMFAVVMIIFKTVQAARQRSEQLGSYLGEVEASIDGVSVRCTGLLDTGNQLVDPLTRIPVMIMELSLWSTYFPESWERKLKNGEADNLVTELGEEEFRWQDRLRLIPYRGINKGTAFMLALKPDEVTVTMNGLRSTSKRVLIGLDSGTLSSEGRYRAVIHPDLIVASLNPEVGGI
ncbi:MULTISPECIES: sigma-E processing peptidase SpoIIGA [Paenibacillus]|uniref:sigma-E processing peptidase SpoIIGA n=1 Tax=Paenibacillus TaxID=44249 RepID=UPI0003660939|nr:sigma-E processing peptidase SpoIIGA [Paenibacillus massiliensis]